MTPERRKYFMKSSNKERIIRGLIRRCKQALSISKSECNAFNLKPADKKPLEYLEKYIQLKDSKTLLQALRHELARIKGMDRVLVPRKAYIGAWGDKGGLCKCGKHITDVHNYCPSCGKRLLWEKVK